MNSRRLQRAALTLGLVLPVACGHTRAEPPPPAAVAPTKPDHEYASETGIPVASTPQGLLRNGAEERIQRRLEAQRLLTESQRTGRLDEATRNALRTFQRKEGLPTTGLPSYETVDHLGLKLDDIFHSVARPRDPG